MNNNKEKILEDNSRDYNKRTIKQMIEKSLKKTGYKIPIFKANSQIQKNDYRRNRFLLI